MIIGGVIVIYCAAAFADSTSANETRTLPNVNTLSALAQSFLQQTSAGRPSASADGFLAQEFPFQLLSAPPQFENLVALLNNISQSLKPQSGQQRIDGDGVSSAPIGPRVLHASSDSFSNRPIYTTLPFNELNITEFSWLWGNMSANGNSSDSDPNHNERIRAQQKLFGTGNTTFGDLSFLGLPQLLSLFGR